MKSDDEFFKPFWDHRIIVGCQPDGDTYNDILSVLGQDQWWFVCADGEFLCRDCAHGNIGLIAPATMTKNPGPDHLQWRIVGAQKINTDPSLEAPEQCAHCYTKHPTE